MGICGLDERDSVWMYGVLFRVRALEYAYIYRSGEGEREGARASFS